jgi:hypothetical protein
MSPRHEQGHAERAHRRASRLQIIDAFAIPSPMREHMLAHLDEREPPNPGEPTGRTAPLTPPPRPPALPRALEPAGA